jgi:hypothetical protein
VTTQTVSGHCAELLMFDRGGTCMWPCTCPTCMLAEKLCRGLCAFEAEPSRRASTSCLASLTPPMASHSPPGIVRGLLQQLRQPRQAVYLHTCVPAAAMLRLYPRAGRHAFGQHVRPLPVWCNANVRPSCPYSTEFNNVVVLSSEDQSLCDIHYAKNI